MPGNAGPCCVPRLSPPLSTWGSILSPGGGTYARLGQDNSRWKGQCERQIFLQKSVLHQYGISLDMCFSGYVQFIRYLDMLHVLLLPVLLLLLHMLVLLLV